MERRFDIVLTLEDTELAADQIAEILREALDNIAYLRVTHVDYSEN
jgi:hypothetical protein